MQQFLALLTGSTFEHIIWQINEILIHQETLNLKVFPTIFQDFLKISLEVNHIQRFLPFFSMFVGGPLQINLMSLAEPFRCFGSPVSPADRKLSHPKPTRWLPRRGLKSSQKQKRMNGKWHVFFFSAFFWYDSSCSWH